MARKLKITVTSASNLVVMQDYDSTTLEIYKILNCGTGEFTLEQSGSVDLTASGAMLTFVHKSGTRFGAVKITDVESVTINGVAATITNLSLVRDAVAPYFFNIGSGEFAFYTEVTLTSAILLNDIAAPGYIILPAVADHYYDFKINWEYTRGTTSYSTGASAISFDMLDGSMARQCCQINGLNLSFASSRVCPNIRPTIVSTSQAPFPIGSAIYFRLLSNVNATLGDGSVLLKIWYNLIPFAG